MAVDWSLKELYESFDCESFKNDLDKYDAHIQTIKAWTKTVLINHEEEKEKLETIIKDFLTLGEFEEKLMAFTSLILSVESKNEQGIKYQAILENKSSDLAGTMANIYQWISEIKELDIVVASSELLTAHSFFIHEIVEEAAHQLGEKEEEIIARMATTGSSAWANYKNLLISMHKVEIEEDGEKKEYPLTVALNMAYSSDKEVRKRAYHAEIESYKKIEDGVAAALNGIKGEAITVCELRGYQSPLEMTLEQSRMDQETLDAMLTAMKESMPKLRSYLRRKAELLGYNNGLPFYELYAPVSEKDMAYTYEQGQAFVEENFTNFSENLGKYARNAFDKSWLDVYPKEGKRSGAFCSNLHSIKESRFLLNFGNSFSDVITMAHELGHGFHGHCLNDETALNTMYPMPLAETASTFCETIVKKAAIKQADKEEAFSILDTELSDATQVIVDIYSRYLFESTLFEKRKVSPLTVEEIKNAMLDAQREAYGDGLDPEFLHPYMWTWKPHYYFTTRHFYNFPYAFGLLFAKGLYAQYLANPETFPSDYEKLLALTGKMKIADVTKAAQIDVHDVDFWRASIQTIEEDVEAFIQLSYEI
ncbi:M3 family oligoendopeptidase [Niameybacter sp.]|uniref:M3 family oligoendopeptidase n=1 Tax=Niameybacter sp. TaxID=2033640 RepID=UPI002FC8DE93